MLACTKSLEEYWKSLRTKTVTLPVDHLIAVEKSFSGICRLEDESTYKTECIPIVKMLKLRTIDRKY